MTRPLCRIPKFSGMLYDATRHSGSLSLQSTESRMIFNLHPHWTSPGYGIVTYYLLDFTSQIVKVLLVSHSFNVVTVYILRIPAIHKAQITAVFYILLDIFITRPSIKILKGIFYKRSKNASQIFIRSLLTLIGILGVFWDPRGTHQPF